MTIHILFIQGGGEGTHDHWDNKLVASLGRALGADTSIHYPRMPYEDEPSYTAWKPALVRALESLDDGAVLVGHSLGGAFLLQVLVEARLTFRPRALILIAAPFFGPGGWPGDEIAAHADLAQRLPADMPVILVHGTDDETVPYAHAELYARALPQAVLRPAPRRDHQLNDDLRSVGREIRSLAL